MTRCSRVTGVTLAVGVLALGAFGLVGCAHSPSSSSADEQRQELVAQERVADLARDISATRPDDIDGWARAAVASATGASAGDSADIELIGIDAQQSIDPNDPFGRLGFRVPVPELEFDFYGKVGAWETADGVDAIDCPDDAAIVTPPVDDSTVEVVSANAREVATAVLRERSQTGLPAEPDLIVAAISAQLADPTAQFEVAAQPRVVVEAGSDGDRVGVAFGSASDCVLVKSETGRVEDVYPAPMTLQPSSPGCTPETALTDPDQLRSPH
jgi:hypothetical protein